jgi:hypothetical protein
VRPRPPGPHTFAGLLDHGADFRGQLVVGVMRDPAVTDSQSAPAVAFNQFSRALEGRGLEPNLQTARPMSGRPTDAVRKTAQVPGGSPSIHHERSSGTLRRRPPSRAICEGPLQNHRYFLDKDSCCGGNALHVRLRHLQVARVVTRWAQAGATGGKRYP